MEIEINRAKLFSNSAFIGLLCSAGTNFILQNSDNPNINESLFIDFCGFHIGSVFGFCFYLLFPSQKSYRLYFILGFIGFLFSRIKRKYLLNKKI